MGLEPVYDNGSSLFPKLNTDEKLQAVLKPIDGALNITGLSKSTFYRRMRENK